MPRQSGIPTLWRSCAARGWRAMPQRRRRLRSVAERRRAVDSLNRTAAPKRRGRRKAWRVWPALWALIGSINPEAAFFSVSHGFPLLSELQEVVARLRVIERVGDRAQLVGAFAPLSRAPIWIVGQGEPRSNPCGGGLANVGFGRGDFRSLIGVREHRTSNAAGRILVETLRPRRLPGG